MRRVLSILLVAILSGSMAGEVILPPVDPCQQASDCCAPDAGCDENCVVCLRCANHTPSVMAFFSTDPVVVPVSSAATTPGALALPLLPTDILHVPRSLQRA
jgi:hypothetical protein